MTVSPESQSQTADLDNGTAGIDTDTAGATPAAQSSFPVRRVSFADPLDGLTKHFAKDSNIVISHLLVQLSTVFPAGEEFFVRSVRAFRDDITDPVLRKEIANFIGQESVHGREHREMNERFQELGYRTMKTDRWTDWRLKKVTNTQSPILCLAVTVALEHCTAVLAEMMLETDASDYLGHPGVQSFMLWHALEESEHKSVAFDVYKAVGGSEEMRVKVMRAMLRIFTARAVGLTAWSLLRDRETYRRGRLRRDLAAFRKSPLLDRKRLQALLDFNRPDFHPNDHETAHLVDQWREELFGPDGTLTPHLGGSARAEAAAMSGAAASAA